MHLLREHVSDAKVIVAVNNDKRIRSSVARHAFVSEISMLHPASKSPEPPRCAVDAVHYSCRLNSEHILDVLFPDLSSGRLRILCDRKLNSHDSFSIESGIMTLSLLKETYQKMGLDGHPSQVMKGKWLVSLNFATPGFSSPKNLHRLRKSLAILGTDIEVKACCDEGQACSEAARAVLGCPISTSRHCRREFAEIPEAGRILQNTFKEGLRGGTFHEAQEDIHTYLTLLSRKYKVKSRQDPFVSVFECPSPSIVQELTVTTLEGFFPPKVSSSLLHSIRQGHQSESWSFIQMIGLQHAPIAWHGSEHGYFTAGENVVSVLQCNMVEQAVDLIVLWEIIGRDSKHS